jgi:general secretion pathway protein C
MKDKMNIVRMIRQGLERISHLPAGLSLSAGVVQLVLMVVAITLISFYAVDIFYTGVQLQFVDSSAGQKSRPAPQTLQNQRSSLEDHQVISQRNLFLTTLTALADKTVGLTPSEEYTAFDLKGTIAVNESMGFAIVEEKGKGKQKLYRLGEMIGSARLIRVTRNEAVLNSGGRDLVMKIKETGEGALSGGVSRPSGSGIAISKQEVTESLGDLKSIMSQAVVRPFFNEGVQQGYIVSNIVPGSLYERLGLKNGDIIVDVNNKKLDSADDVLQLVNVMQSGGGVSVNLMRNGKTESINYSFH